MAGVMPVDKTVLDPLNIKFYPRNDFVILQQLQVDKVKDLYVPQGSKEAKRLVVFAVGPKVEGLKVGDFVQATGQVGVDWSPIPNRPDLIIVREGNVVLRYEMPATPPPGLAAKPEEPWELTSDR